MHRIRIFDIPVDLLTREELIEGIISRSANREKTIVGNVNTKALNLAWEKERYKKYLQGCDLVYVDGYGPLLGGQMLGYRIRKAQRNTCPDFIDCLLDKITEEGKNIFFLCGTPEVIKRLNAIFVRKHPQLNYQAHHGFFNKTGMENDEVIGKINDFHPDILYVGFGMPLQAYWILDNFDAIDTNVFLPEGACLDFYTDTAYRAPQILTEYGLEWLARLAAEPKRLWRRYLIGNPKFLYRVMKQKWQKK